MLISAVKKKLEDENRAQRVKLAHEIAFNNNFKVPDESDPPPPEDKSIEANLGKYLIHTCKH